MIGIITYDTPHRKTQDLVTSLMLSGYSELHLIVLPWAERINFQPIYKHRLTISPIFMKCISWGALSRL